MKQPIWMQVNEIDNVAVALENLEADTTLVVNGVELIIRERIPKGHKIALQTIQPNEHIIKYGFPMGHASEAILAGSWVHTHNTLTNLDDVLEYEYEPEPNVANIIVKDSASSQEQFMGYMRSDGQAGIRNEIWIVNTVGCVNKTAEMLAKEANIQFEGKTDGIFSFSHPYGCSQLGDDHEYTRKVLAGLVRHPNAAGVLVLGLGCENNTISSFRDLIHDVDPNKVRFLAVQDVEDEMEAGLERIGELVEYASTFQRTPCPVSKLIVGLKCGGSDAFSGITANPLLGRFSDLLIEAGGATILTEVPEMFGAETILMNRCVNEEVFEDTVGLINNFKQYYKRYNQVIYENPSPGNKEGGITTLEEKSLGCTQKGGTSPVVGVIPYGGQVRGAGLHLLQGPGNDIVSITALTAAGAHMVLFSTGRGTPLGGPVPTVKVATNSGLAERKRNWIDWNAGALLEGKAFPEATNELYQYTLEIASGKQRTKNEQNGYKEIAIFKDGVTL